MGTLKIRRKDALYYHEKFSQGNIEFVPTKEMQSQYDLALTNTPGVTQPCLYIAENPPDVYRCTSKGNFVGVVSNGSAVLGSKHTCKIAGEDKQ